jgi:membrane-associated protein
VSGLVDRLLGLPGWLVLVITGLVVFAEDALFFGFVLPGETVALLAGVAAKLGHASLVGVLVVVVVVAIVGDTVGYEVGRHLGPRVLDLPLLQKRRERLDSARAFLARRGGSAVFLGRWVAFFRAVMPALAGTARMPYRRFLVFNAAGGLAWGVTVVLLGYAAGASYARVEKVVGRDAALIVLAVVVLVVWRFTRRR